MCPTQCRGLRSQCSFGIVSELNHREGGARGRCHGTGLGREAEALGEEAGGVVEGERECPVIQASKTLKTGNWAKPLPSCCWTLASTLVSSGTFCSRTRATSREEKNLQAFLEQPKEKWVESAFEVDGPHYFTVLALHVLPPEKWRATRVEILRRLLVTSQARAVAPGGATRSVPASESTNFKEPSPAVCRLDCVFPVCVKNRLAMYMCLGKVCLFALVIGPDSSHSTTPRV